MPTMSAAQAERNIRAYYVLEATQSAAFVMGSWLFFWLRVMSFGQLGAVDAFAFAFGMLMEVPTGAIGDLLGKRRTMQAAMACLGIGYIIMGASQDFAALFIGFLFAQVGWAFYSGAAEALCYDTLKETGQTERYDSILQRAALISTIVLMLSSLIGGLMYPVWDALPHLAWGLSFFLGLIATLWLTEPHIEQEHFNVRVYVRQLGLGFRYLFAPALIAIVPLMLVVRGGGYMFSMGLIQPTMAADFGYDAGGQAVLGTILFLVAQAGIWAAPWVRRRMGVLRGMFLAGMLLALGYAGAALPLGLWGIVCMSAVRFSSGLSYPLGSVLVNEAIPSEARATTLSTVALLIKLPYVFTAIIAGQLAESGQFGLFGVLVGAGMVAVMALTAWLRLRRPQARPSMAGD